MEKLWRKTVEFHGHECPGLAIGFQAALAAKEYLGCTYSEDEELVCISENDACGVDALQVVLKCTLGKGNLMIRLTGKSVYHFYNRVNGKSIRLSLKPSPKPMNKEDYKKYFLSKEPKDLFDASETNIDFPEKARIFNPIICDKCKEKTADHYIRIQNDQKLCLDCFNEYKRFYINV
ncbi:FmdE family protein [Tepidibacter hydrothermalis]|uniref:FmdE family protein n=1 Tax=Tepidibacter hydrothermalis TaxID=3036126 RepID=A0ABY8EIH4_9FIRM|nr:FmdE family protein [Tepidibacter hydrothermalis]WFD10710.1 FmdE family protein [Tepidibacter hydrothermalis]